MQVELVKVDIDANPQIANAFRVQSIPAVLRARRGQGRRLVRRRAPRVDVRAFVETLRPGAPRSTSCSTRATRCRCSRARELEPTRRRRGASPSGAPSTQRSRSTRRWGCWPRSRRSCEAGPSWPRMRAGRRSGVALDGDHELTLADLLEQSRDDDAAPRSCIRDPRRARARGPALRVVPAKTRQPPLLVRRLPPSGADTRSRSARRRYDVTSRALVMGMLNRTNDSFFAPAATFDLDALFERADRLVAEGADLLDVGGVKAGPGDEVDEAEELDRVVPVVEPNCARDSTSRSGSTPGARRSRAAASPPARCIGNDISGFADPGYLRSPRPRAPRSSRRTSGCGPASPTPIRVYDDVVATVARVLPLGASGRWTRASRPSGSSSTRGSTSARPPPSRCNSCATRDRSRRSARRSCCRPRTRRSSGVLFDLAVHERTRAVTGRDGARHLARGVVSFGSMTSRERSGCAT